MKKTYLIIAATALVALSACTKNEVRSISDEPSQITWQTVIGPKSTKALVEGNTFDQKYKFKTYAFYNANGTTWPTGASLYIDNAEVEYHSTAVEGKPFAANSWHADQVYYWPKGGSLTFISYTIVNGDENNKATSYPANVSCTVDNGLKVSGYDVDANQNLDFMVAYATGQTANTTSSAQNEKGVPTAFKHALTQIVGFNVTTKDNYKKEDNGVVKAGSYVIKIKGIKIVNPYNKGDYSLKDNATGAWDSSSYTETSDKSTYAYKTSDGNPAELNKTTAVNLVNDQKAFLPQTFAEPNYSSTSTKEEIEAAIQAVPHIKLSYTTYYYREDGTVAVTDDVSEYVALSAIHPDTRSWGINKKITYNVTISLAGKNNEYIIYWDPKVTDWEIETGTIEL